ncbi:MAG: hypothetical protein ABSG73_13470 [Candidatus Aminicenantales bacterium]
MVPTLFAWTNSTISLNFFLRSEVFADSVTMNVLATSNFSAAFFNRSS